MDLRSGHQPAQKARAFGRLESSQRQVHSTASSREGSAGRFQAANQSGPSLQSAKNSRPLEPPVGHSTAQGPPVIRSPCRPPKLLHTHPLHHLPLTEFAYPTTVAALLSFFSDPRFLSSPSSHTLCLTSLRDTNPPPPPLTQQRPAHNNLCTRRLLIRDNSRPKTD